MTSAAESKATPVTAAEDYLPPHTAAWSLGKRKRFAAYADEVDGRLADKSGQHQHLEDCVAEGDPVILEHSKGRVFAEAGSNKRVRLHKDMFVMDGLMRTPFGAYFAAEKGKFARREAPESEVDTKITGSSLRVSSSLNRRCVLPQRP
jgi:hypothetical protein